MIRRAQLDWAPAYELNVSLQGFAGRRLGRILDLGIDWTIPVRRGLPAGFVSELDRAERSRIRGETPLVPVDLLIHRCPADRSAEGFLVWLESLSPEDLYERVVSETPEKVPEEALKRARDEAPEGARDETPSPSDLRAARETLVRLLSTWHEAYFRRVDPAVLARLEEDARMMSVAAAASERPEEALGPGGVVERATRGIVIVDPPPGIGRVVLYPQHHLSPLNVVRDFRSMILIGYPVDLHPPEREGERPGPDRLRATRAAADATRLRVLRTLSSDDGVKPREIAELARQTGLPAAVVWRHLLVLRSAGLVRTHHRPGYPDAYSHRPPEPDRL